MRTTSAAISHPQQNASNKRLLTNQSNGIFDIQIQTKVCIFVQYTKVCIAQIASRDCHSQSKLRFSFCSSFIYPFLQFIVPHPILFFCYRLLLYVGCIITKINAVCAVRRCRCFPCLAPSPFTNATLN